MANATEKIRVAITQGDINGVGPEVIVKSLANPDILEIFTPVIFGSPAVFEQVTRDGGYEDFRFEILKSAGEVKDGQINLVTTGDESATRNPGKPSEASGRQAVAALEAAEKAVKEGLVEVIVTAPIDKKSAQSESFHFPGHTEFLAERFPQEGESALMILADGNLRVALVTTHEAVKDVAHLINKERVAQAIRSFARTLKKDFGCERPKIAVLALNPHCGDGGLLGREEETAIVPAVEECRAEGIMAFGPISADGFFGSGAYANFDGILAMYHDQGLAPFKALAAGGGVNITTGLSVVRTSPAHGTAYDKAGTGEADDSSMRQALYAAIDIFRTRKNFEEMSANPLPITERPQRDPKNKRKEATEEETVLPEND